MNHRGAIVLLALFALGSLAGCSLAPRYERPEMDIPAEWSAPDAEQGGIAVQWWTRFNDPALDALVEEALRKNRDLEQALASVDAARARLGVATSFLFPAVNVDGGWGMTGLSLKGPSPVPDSLDRTQPAYQGGFSAAWELDFWGKYRNTRTMLSDTLFAAKASYVALRLTVAGTTCKSYFTLLSLDLQEEIARRTLRTREDALRIYTDRFKAGDITELDHLRAKAETEVARVALHETLAAREAAEAALLALIGRSPRDIMEKSPERGMRLDRIPAAPALPAGLPSLLLERRPDIVSAEYALTAANANIGAARADFFPSISLTGTFGTLSVHLRDLFTGPAGAWNYGVQGVMPLLDFGRIWWNVKDAEAQKRMAVAVYNKTVQNAFADIRTVLARQRESSRIVESRAAEATSLSKAAGLARVRYDNGYSSYLEVLDAERQLFNAELQSVAALSNRLNAVVDVCMALGGGWEDPEAATEAANSVE
jgi:multidrug efflux system outer membrane protein